MCVFVLWVEAVRFFGFDASRMRTPASMPFEQAVMAVLGMQSSEMSFLHSSLPSELTFNMLRDAARRHAKQERASAASLHSVASAASAKHSFGCVPLDLEDQDWGLRLSQTTMKTATDRELGISAEGLTKHRNNKNYTKPHVWCARLELLQVLADLYGGTQGDVENKKNTVMTTYNDMWVSKVMPEIWLTQRKEFEQDQNPEECWMVTKAGPYVASCLCMVRDGENYVLKDKPQHRLILTSLDDFVVAKVKAVLSKDGQLQWSKSSTWMSITDYICDHGILTITAGLLTSVCSALRLKAGRLDHVLRAELFLKHFGRSEEWIEEVLEQLRAKQRKRKEKKEKEEDEEEKNRGEQLGPGVQVL